MRAAQLLIRTVVAFGAWCALTIPAGLNAQAAQRQTRVEVMILQAPIPVATGGKTVLAYELHITNFDLQSLVLRSVDVLSETAPDRPLTTLRDSALRAAFQAVGSSMGSMRQATSSAPNASLRINPGQRAVVFVWLALDRNAAIPARLRHRIEFDLVDSTTRAETGGSSVIDGLVLGVSLSTPLAIATPMRGGDWLAGEGPSNSSSHRRALVPLDGKAWISQRFATDWVKIGPNGNTWRDDRTRNENFWGFGEPVLAVADAEVVSAVDTIDDNTPGRPLPAATIANIPGNYVILRLDKSTYVLYAHLKRGSIRAHAGQRVRRGEVLRRAFERRFGVTPSAYRSRFAAQSRGTSRLRSI